MIELNNGPDRPHRKSARIVGDTMGKYHPHGDSSIYGALVNLAPVSYTHLFHNKCDDSLTDAHLLFCYMVQKYSKESSWLRFH